MIAVCIYSHGDIRQSLFFEKQIKTASDWHRGVSAGGNEENGTPSPLSSPLSSCLIALHMFTKTHKECNEMSFKSYQEEATISPAYFTPTTDLG